MLAGRDDRVEEPFRGWVDLGRSSEGRERESEPLRAKRQTRETSEGFEGVEKADTSGRDESGSFIRELQSETLYRVATLFRHIQAKSYKDTNIKMRPKRSKRVEKSRAAENVIDRGRPRCDAGVGRAWTCNEIGTRDLKMKCKLAPPRAVRGGIGFGCVLTLESAGSNVPSATHETLSRRGRQAINDLPVAGRLNECYGR